MAEQLVNYLDIDLTPLQVSMVNLIETEFSKGGLSRALTAAAIVNAYKESKFDPYAKFYGKNYEKTGVKTEDSVGLFMLNNMNDGLGTGMPVGPEYPSNDSRKNPTLNTQRIIRKIKNTKAAREEFAKYEKDLPGLTASFTKWIEVPGELAKAMAERKALAKKLFPNGIEGTNYPRGYKGPVTATIGPAPETTAVVPAPDTSAADAQEKLKKAMWIGLGALAVVSVIRYKATGKKPWEL
jgi:hypothetical protein